MKNITVGQLVVVAKNADTQLYKVKELCVNEQWVKLSYVSGNCLVGGGDIPKCSLLKPTKAQLNHRYNTPTRDWVS